jgi:thiamine-monophosphate kinase
MDREDQLIKRVSLRFPFAGDGLRVGIGDDAAILRPRVGSEWVVTTDAFLENVHFLRNIQHPRSVGYKALARATSDIAAMGARPRYFFMTLGLPEACAGTWFDGFLGGLARAARRFGLVLAGGDTTKYPLVTISLTVMGEVDRGQAILRSGARPGDLLCVSGRLGEAELGLRLIQEKLHKQKSWAKLLKKHFYPEPRLALGVWLAGHRAATSKIAASTYATSTYATSTIATSMIDTSDGLSTDLGHICEASGVGAIVWAREIPLARVPVGLTRRGFDPLDMALHGGEDYELLFTVSKKFSSRLPARVGGVPITVIGEMTRAKKVILLGTDGRTTPLQAKGWDPFRKKS